MSVDYNNFAKTFAKSRKNMKWPELEYFFSLLQQGNVLDIGCGSGRFIESYKDYFDSFPEDYVGIDMSSGLIDQAVKVYPNYKFHVANMLDIDEIFKTGKFKNIFLIASFHHLNSLKDRKKMMSKLYDLLDEGGKVFMTNWALESDYNSKKYKDSKIKGSENEFNSSDYSIKIGEFDRYYHCFDISELDFLAENSGFTIMENRLFDNKKNIITILQK